MVFSLGDKYTTPDTETSFDNSTQILPTAEMVKAEMAARGDLLLGDFVDSYNNLTLKSLHALRLFVNSELEFTHFFKGELLMKSFYFDAPCRTFFYEILCN